MGRVVVKCGMSQNVWILNSLKLVTMGHLFI